MTSTRTLERSPPRRVARRALAAFARLLALALGLALAACGPDYNWREVRPAGEGYQVLLPGKPADMQRPIDLAGLQVRMTMHGAQAQGAAFVVGSVHLPDASAETRHKATEAMRYAMVRNIAGTERDATAVTIPVIDAQGRAIAQAPAMRVRAEGRVRDKPTTLVGVFVARGDRAWQAVAVGEGLDVEQAGTFVESLRLVP